MWIPYESFHAAFGPATPSTAAVPANLSTNYGGPRIQETDTVQNFPFGFRIRAYEPLLGAGEFIYLQGIGSTVAGSLVNYNPFTGASTLNVPSDFNAVPLAVAMAPTVANLFGWYQMAGTMTAVNNATAAAGSAFQVGTGTISSTSTVSRQILGGARILVANGSTFTKTGTTRNGSVEVAVSNLDGVFVGCPVSGTGIPGGATVAAGYNNSPNARNSSAGSSTTFNLSAAATADGTVTVTFTRTNFSLLSGNNISGQGIIT
jgi:hypothetical protein